jgi:Rrf2 family protein
VFKIAKAQDQVLRLAMRLAIMQRQCTLGELADLERMPEPMAAKLLNQLRRAGVVAAIRGRHGGYELAAPPQEISVAAVLRALGNPVPKHRCSTHASREGDCPREADCGLRAVWLHLQAKINQVLEQTTLADLSRAEESMHGHVNRIWPLEVGSAQPHQPAEVIHEGQ